MADESDARAAISNELDHELLVLDGPSAVLWEQLERRPRGARAAEIAEVVGAPTQEVRAFLNELWDARLLMRDGEVAPAPSEPKISEEGPEPLPRGAEHQRAEVMPGGDNLEFEFEMHDWAVARGHLWSAAWEMTYRCNESCLHCFNPGASHHEGQTPRRRTDELTTVEGIQLLRDLREIGVFRLLLTGGEVLLRKDFSEILAAARSLGFSVTIFTNGVLLDDEAVQRLVRLYPHRVELSLYSHNAERHDAITRVSGSHARTIQTTQQLLSQGVTVALKMIVMKPTAPDTEEFRALCAELGCEALLDYNLSAGVDGAQAPVHNLSATAGDLVRAALRPGSHLYVGTLEHPLRRAERPSGSICGAGRTTIGISPDGNISPCISMPTYAGSVRIEGAASVWRRSAIGSAGRDDGEGEDALTSAQRLTWEQSPYCGGLDRCAWCQRCPGLPLLETGNERSPSIVLCRNAAARMIAFEGLIEQGDGVVVDEQFLEAAHKRHPSETELWNSNKAADKRLAGLDDLRNVLRARIRASALVVQPQMGQANR